MLVASAEHTSALIARSRVTLANGYDWCSWAATVNALPGQRAALDGTDVFYLRFEAEKPGALPIVLTHGWPTCWPSPTRPRGGHFAAHEEPALLASDLTEFSRPLR